MSRNATNKDAIVTVTDSNFLSGTLVLLYSFLQHNEWYKGDIIIIEDNLKDGEKSQFNNFPNVRFEKPSRLLLDRINILSQFWNPAKENPRQFYSIESFRFVEYNHILYLDSDMLCMKSLKSLFENDVKLPLLATLDMLDRKGELREESTFLPIPINQRKESEKYFKSFNSGMLLINVDYLPSDSYNDLIKLVNPITFNKNYTRHTDQFLLNTYFKNRVRFISFGYNYLLNIESNAMTLDEIKNGSTVYLIHFIEGTKPWLLSNSKDSFWKLWQDYQRFTQSFVKMNKSF